jgi:5-methylcytosine-specific restriction endonuclease McrA
VTMRRFSPAYRAHLRSPAWQALRARRLARDRYRCVRCGSRRQLEVDHLTYVRLGHEWLSDCQTLCRPCHRLKTRQDRRGRAWRRHGGVLPLLVLALVLGLMVLLR